MTENLTLEEKYLLESYEGFITDKLLEEVRDANPDKDSRRYISLEEEQEITAGIMALKKIKIGLSLALEDKEALLAIQYMVSNILYEEADFFFQHYNSEDDRWYSFTYYTDISIHVEDYEKRKVKVNELCTTVKAFDKIMDTIKSEIRPKKERTFDSEDYEEFTYISRWYGDTVEVEGDDAYDDYGMCTYALEKEKIEFLFNNFKDISFGKHTKSYFNSIAVNLKFKELYFEKIKSAPDSFWELNDGESRYKFEDECMDYFLEDLDKAFYEAQEELLAG